MTSRPSPSPAERRPFHERLRSAAMYGPLLPPLDLAAAPSDPVTLFLDWLDAVIAAGGLAPQVMTLSTADAAGRVAARSVTLRDLDDSGWYFATQSTSPKAHELADNPNAALTFFWPVMGRQVRVVGPVVGLGAERSARDSLARPDASRAAGLVGHQSEQLGSADDYARAFAAALARAEADPQLAAPTWALYALQPTTVEFWQATADRGQTRLRYTAVGAAWEKGLLWP